MSRYLVIGFNRYQTEDSTHHFVEAVSPTEAYAKIYTSEDVLVEVDETFSFVSYDEYDVLIYKI